MSRKRLEGNVLGSSKVLTTVAATTRTVNSTQR
jgi:hypothetical protein